MKNIPHRFYTFEVPTHPPHFDRADRRWTTIVGEFFQPIVRDREVVGFVFLNHEPVDIELRLAADDYHTIETRIYAHANKLGIKPKARPTDGETIGHAFCGDRWLAADKQKDVAAAARRSTLAFRFLHLGCELLLDNLVSEGAYWRIESNPDKKENPNENSFESLLHLISNFSQAKFDLILVPPPASGTRAFTTWMTKAENVQPASVTSQLIPGTAPAGVVRCHL